jgi:hypothetical protein
MRLRKPWVRARLRFLGWYVRFIGSTSVAVARVKPDHVGP